MEQQKIKIFNFRPLYLTAFIAILAPLILNGCIEFQKDILIGVIISFAFALLICAAFLFFYKFHKIAVLLLISLIIFIIISVNGLVTIFNYQNSEQTLSGVFDVEVSEIISVEYGKDINNYFIKGKFYNDNKVCNGYINLSTSYKIYQGYNLTLKCNFTKLDGVSENYNSIYKKIFYSAYNPTVIAFNQFKNAPFTSIKENLLNILNEHMPLSAGFSYGILTGDTVYITKSVLTDFRNVGTAHIFAVSGLHIGFLYAMLSIFLKAIKLNKKFHFYIICPILLLYVAFCGFSPSCIRAFVIVSTLTLSKALGVKADRISALLLSLIIVLIINPFDLFSIGFQLSFVIYSSLILLVKPFEKLLDKIMPKSFSKILSPAIIAFLSSLPIIIDNFESASLFTCMFNIVIIPLVSVVYSFLFIISVFALLINWLGILLIVPDLILGALIFVISKMETTLFMLGGFVFSLSKIPYYFIMVNNSGLLNSNKKTKRLIDVLSICFFIILIVVINSI